MKILKFRFTVLKLILECLFSKYSNKADKFYTCVKIEKIFSKILREYYQQECLPIFSMKEERIYWFQNKNQYFFYYSDTQIKKKRLKALTKLLFTKGSTIILYL